MNQNLILLTIILIANGSYVFGFSNSEGIPCIENKSGISSWKYKLGDESKLDWTSQDFDDSKWKDYELYKESIFSSQTILFRANLKLCDKSKIGEIFYIHLSTHNYSTKIYWDGKLVGENGKIDKHGNVKQYGTIKYSIPIKYIPSSDSCHLLALKFPFVKDQIKNLHFNIQIGFSEINKNYDTRFYLYHFSYITVSLVGIVFGLVLFLAGGSFRPYLLVVLICLPLFILKIYEFSMYYFNLPTQFVVGTKVFSYLFYFSQLSIITFFIIIFNPPYKIIHIIFVALILFVQDFDSWFYNSINLWLSTLYWFAIIIFAIYKKKSGSLISLILFLIMITPDLLKIFDLSIPDIYFHASYWLFIVGLFVVAGIHLSEQTELKRSVERRSKRLEHELIKKTIQPHFIANSLSAIRSLSKTNPDKANRLIQAIASEFNILNKIISESVIPIEKEIELCKFHLEVMGLRRDAKYELIVKNLPENLSIPPLIFHTLIENGVIHSLQPEENGVFIIQYFENDNVAKFTIKNNGSKLKDLSNKHNYIVDEGLGYKYIKSRLEEKFGSKWNLDYGISNDYWQTIITINK